MFKRWQSAVGKTENRSEEIDDRNSMLKGTTVDAQVDEISALEDPGNNSKTLAPLIVFTMWSSMWHSKDGWVDEQGKRR